MPKSISVTVTLSFGAEVPSAWLRNDGEELAERLQDALDITVKATKNVDLGDVEIEIDAQEC